VQKIDNITWVAMACVAAGWFWMNTLIATFGPIQHVVHFYELPSAMKDPRWLLAGIGASASLSTIGFGIACLLMIPAPLLPRLGYPHVPWLLSCAPVLLMLLCGITLYVKSSSTHIEATDSLGRIGGYVAHWANGATAWTGDVVARHIRVGAGGYLAFIASGFLAVKGIRDQRGSSGRLATRSLSR
jgi:hypothetical protein